MKKFIESNGRVFVNTRLLSDGNFWPLPCVKQGGNTYVGLGELLRTELLDELCNSHCFKTSTAICTDGYVVEYSAEVVMVSSFTIQAIAGLFNYRFITDFHVEPCGDHLSLKITSYVPNK